MTYAQPMNTRLDREAFIDAEDFGNGDKPLYIEWSSGNYAVADRNVVEFYRVSSRGENVYTFPHTFRMGGHAKTFLESLPGNWSAQSLEWYLLGLGFDKS